uniref:Methyltransferase n=1 Tax=Salix viminalis TaxID=40686 RepID=A0A6N2K8U9_SALVM
MAYQQGLCVEKQFKGGQNWVHEKDKLWWFPGGGTHFKHGAADYIERLGNMITDDTGDLRSAGVVQVLDVGCASQLIFFLWIYNVFCSKDGHENQIQFALERGIGAMTAAIATKQLPYPSSSFEMVHCSRCRVDWHENAPPAYRKDKDYPLIWDKLVNLTSAMCWKLIAQKVQTAIWVKQENEACLLHNAEMKQINICDTVDDMKPSWKTPLRDCIPRRSAHTNHRNCLPDQNVFLHIQRVSVKLVSLKKSFLQMPYSGKIKLAITGR